MAKILIADDDQTVIDVVVQILGNAGFTLETAPDGSTARQLVLQFGYDAILLDWQMPGVTGIEILKEYRAKGGKAPVLMLTGLTEIERKETGFDSGADDYLTKPFHPKELLLRVKALLRRPGNEFQEVLQHDGVELDPNTKQVRVDGNIIMLAGIEFALIEFLMRHPNVVFSPEALLERVWKSDVEVAPAAVKVCVNRIRSKLNLTKDRLIKNIHGQGYILESRSAHDKPD